MRTFSYCNSFVNHVLIRSVSNVNAATVLTEESPPYRTNWRPPFDSHTGTVNGKKGNEIRWKNRPQNQPRPPKEQQFEKLSRPCPGTIALVRRSLRRFVQMAIASTDSVEIQRLMSSAREAFDMERALLGKEPLPSKRSPKSTAIAPNFPMPDASGNQVESKPLAHPASGQDSPAPVPDHTQDDTPF